MPVDIFGSIPNLAIYLRWKCVYAMHTYINYFPGFCHWVCYSYGWKVLYNVYADFFWLFHRVSCKSCKNICVWGVFFFVVCLSRVWFLLYLTFRFILICIYSVPLLFHLVVCRYFIGLAQYYVHRDRMQTKYKQISNQFVRNITITTIHIFLLFQRYRY